MPEKIALMREDEDRVRLLTPYLPAFVQRLKEGLPRQHRAWDPQRKVWLISTLYIAEVIKLLNECFPGQDIHSDLVGGDGSSVDWVRAVFDACPPKELGRLRRDLMFIFHPDRGGSEETARAINVEFDRKVRK